MSKDNFNSLRFFSDGYDEAYIQYLEDKLKSRNLMMWWAFFGWVVTVIFYNVR